MENYLIAIYVLIAALLITLGLLFMTYKELVKQLRFTITSTTDNAKCAYPQTT